MEGVCITVSQNLSTQQHFLDALEDISRHPDKLTLLCSHIGAYDLSELKDRFNGVGKHGFKDPHYDAFRFINRGTIKPMGMGNGIIFMNLSVGDGPSVSMSGFAIPSYHTLLMLLPLKLITLCMTVMVEGSGPYPDTIPVSMTCRTNRACAFLRIYNFRTTSQGINVVDVPDVASFVDDGPDASWVDIMEHEKINLSDAIDPFYQRSDFLEFKNYEAANNLDHVKRMAALNKVLADRQRHTRQHEYPSLPSTSTQHVRLRSVKTRIDDATHTGAGVS